MSYLVWYTYSIKTRKDIKMKFNPFEDFDIETTYQKLIAPSTPRTVKACDFFAQPDILNPLNRKLKQTVKQKTATKR